MMINDDQKLTMISMFTMISMSKIGNHRYKNSFCEIEPQINIIILRCVPQIKKLSEQASTTDV